MASAGKDARPALTPEPESPAAGDRSAPPPAVTTDERPLTPGTAGELDFDENHEQLNDSDSAFGDGTDQSETDSIASSILRYREENGRTYHAYGTIEHWGPNDAAAQDQQDLSHHFWTLVLDDKFYTAPIENPHSILDCGTGTGIWVIDVADRHPEAEVKGIDLSPIQPSWIPPNAKFEIDDYNLEWQDVNRFDLIHTREILGTVPDWVEFFRKAYRALKPGGWIDCTEPTIYLESIHRPLEPDHPFVLWPKFFTEVGEKTGVTFDVARHLKEWLIAAGFVNVTERKIPTAVGRWPRERSQKEAGLWNQARLDMGLRDFTERRLRNNLGWQNDEIAVLVANCRAAVKNSREGLFINLYFVHGQKPENAV